MPARTMSPCERWIALSDRDAIGERLAAADARFLQSHPRTCIACRAEADVWETMATMLDETSGTRTARRRDEDAPFVSAPSRARDRMSRPVRVGLAAAAIAAAAAALVFAIQPSPRVAATDPPGSTPTAAPPSPPPAPTIVVERMAGRVLVDGRAASPGESLARGATLEVQSGAVCVHLEPGVRACLAVGSVTHVVELGADRRLSLTRGRLVAELDPQPAGTSFGITTRDGSSIAVGTAFAVDVPADDAPVVTRVLHGTVVVRTNGGREERVRAHETFSAGSAAVVTSSPEEEDRDRALLAIGARTDDGGGDGTGVNDARTDGVRDAGTDAAPARRASDVAPRTARDLLAAARERRARGDVGGAAAAYRELVALHGDTPEAMAALVAYGELQLGELSDAPGALATFDRYLARGGALDEEASFGRIRAYRALGQTKEERGAIDAFLVRFPQSALGTTLTSRRAVLETQ